MGESDWQAVLSEVLDRWKTTSPGRVPPGWAKPRWPQPDRFVLTEAGFEDLVGAGLVEEAADGIMACWWIP